jgi:glycosyltransferase involved in cell wall biosynthesis
LSVFFPCFNEEGNLPRVLETSVEVLTGLNADYEIIVINDGSRDNTAHIADQFAQKSHRIRVIHHPTNLGYGAALQSGFKAATKELVFYTDGDGQFDIREISLLLDKIRDADIVSAYRLNRQDSFIRKLNGWCWTQLVCLVFGMRVRDIDCAFKLYRRSLFAGMPLHSTGALIDTEVLARARRKGCRIVQCGVHHYPRKAGHQTGADWRVICRAFRELIQLRRSIMKGG